MKVVHFLGYKDGGKTRAISYFVRALKRRGLRVGTVKHIHDPSFSMDTPGKDTWAHARSGASLVAAVAPHELALITRTDTGRMKVEALLDIFRESGLDYVLVEGFSGGFAPGSEVIRVVCARTKGDAVDLVRKHGTPLCVVGKLDDAPRLKLLGRIPVLQLPRDARNVIRLLGSPQGPRRRRRLSPAFVRVR